MICPGFEEPEFLAVKFPLVPVSESLGPPSAVGLAAGNAAVFLAPVNFKPDAVAPKPFALQPSTSRDGVKKDAGDTASVARIKDGNSASSKHVSSSDIVPSFHSGELTVSVKSTKCDYDFTPADFSKMPNPLASGDNNAAVRTSDFPLADITQQITKFSDLTKLANFSTADLAKLSGFSITDFAPTSSPSPSAYMRNIANLFGPLGKISPAKETESNKPTDFVDTLPPSFKATGTPELCRNFSAEDYTSDRKKLDADSAKIGRLGEYQGTEDLTISSAKPDFGGMLDMTTVVHKKPTQSTDLGDSLNLSKDR